MKNEAPERPVLFGTDFSAAAGEAGEITTLLHVIESRHCSERTRKSRLRKLAHQLRTTVSMVPESHATIDAEVFENEKTGEVLAQPAERLGADLICIGSHGRTGLTKAFLGPVVQTVMKTSKRPMLVVRQQP